MAYQEIPSYVQGCNRRASKNVVDALRWVGAGTQAGVRKHESLKHRVLPHSFAERQKTARSDRNAIPPVPIQDILIFTENEGFGTPPPATKTKHGSFNTNTCEGNREDARIAVEDSTI